jgi:RNA-directed DNA polymerase
MGELLDRALTPDAVNRAWKSVRNDRAPWHVGMSRTEMERNLATHLLRLVDDLRQGRYRPDAMRQFTIAKGDGRRRVLSALTLRDKLAQRAVLSVLDPIGEQLFHHDSFGYRPGRNVAMALARVRGRVHCGLPWLVDADIRAFFDNIPHRPLRKALARVVPDREVLHLIDQWLEVGTYQTGILPPGGPPGGCHPSVSLQRLPAPARRTACAKRRTLRPLCRRLCATKARRSA